jgi:hypothetical protein
MEGSFDENAGFCRRRVAGGQDCESDSYCGPGGNVVSTWPEHGASSLPSRRTASLEWLSRAIGTKGRHLPQVS